MRNRKLLLKVSSHETPSGGSDPREKHGGETKVGQPHGMGRLRQAQGGEGFAGAVPHKRDVLCWLHTFERLLNGEQQDVNFE